MSVLHHPLQDGPLVSESGEQPVHQDHLPEQLTVVCAWHQPAPIVLVQGGPRVSDGCCEACLLRVLGETGETLTDLADELRALAGRV